MSYLDALKRHRKGHGLTQDEVASHLGIGRTSYVNKKRGKQAISADELMLLAELYDVGLDELTGRSAPEPVPTYEVYGEMQWKRTA